MQNAPHGAPHGKTAAALSDSHNLASILLLSHCDDLGMRAVRRESMALLDVNNDGVISK